MALELLRGGARKVVFALAPALLLALVDAFAVPVQQMPWSGGRVGRHLVVAAVIAAGMWILLSAVDARTARDRRAAGGPASWRSCLGMAGISAVLWLLMWAAVGPLDAMNDTYWSIRNPLGVAPQQPLVYSMIISGVVHGLRLVTGSMLPGIIALVLLQVILYGLGLSWTLRVLSRMGVPRAVLLVLAVVLGLLPITANFTFALVKDAAFTGFTLLLVPVLLSIQQAGGRCLRSRGFLCSMVVSALGFALTRNNALVILVLVGVLIVVLARRARRTACVWVAGIVVVALLPQQILTLAAGPQKSVESLGVPLQMVGSTLVHEPQCIAPEDARTLERIMPAQTWRDVFRPQSVDPVKYDPAFSEDALQGSRGEFLAVFARTLGRCPGPMLAGYRDQTSQLWRWDAIGVGGTSQSFFLEPISNAPGDRDEILADLAGHGVTKRPLLGETVGARMEAVYRGGLEATPGAGTWVWALALVMAAAWYGRRGEVLVVAFPALLLWATLMAAAPIAEPFRYVAYLPWILAISAVVLLWGRGRAVSRPGAPRAAARSRRTTPG